MQKKAARRGQRALAFLLCLLMVVTLLPAMGANAAEGGNEVGKDAPATVSENPVLDKFLTEDASGNYTLTLTAYATGTTTTVTEKSGKPLDIVLVLDQSGSMSDSEYVEPLKTAVTAFVKSISDNAKEYNVDHRIALVGYASRYDSNSRWVNTGLFINGSLYNYQKQGSSTETSRLTEQNYQDALVSVNGNDGNVANSITTAISKINGKGATYTNYGMEMANGVFQYNPIEEGSDRQRIVVVFTDGEPGKSGYDQDVANAALSEAYKTKNTYGATVYTVGLYSKASEDVTNFMNYLSSNYPEARSMSDSTEYTYTVVDPSKLDTSETYYVRNGNNYREVTYHTRYWESGWYDDYGWSYDPYKTNFYTRTATSTGGPGSKAADKYYMTTSSSGELDKIFHNISEDIQHPSTDITLNANAELRDQISNVFDVKDGSTITVSTVEGTYNASGEPTWEKPTEIRSDSFSDRNISVTGFDYSSNYIADGHKGKKLVVTITNLIPNNGFGDNKMLSNDPGAGIYESAEATTPAAEFPSPWTRVPVYTKVLDFSMTAKIATSVQQYSTKTNRYGAFSTGSDLTYKLGNRVADGNLVFDGVDSVLFYGDYNDDGNDTAARWNKVNVIPANNVYFDDNLLNEQSTFTDSDQGYDAAVNNATYGVEQVDDKTSREFTFTGTGIDVYCTTEENSGWISAVLLNEDGTRAKDADGNNIKAIYMNNQYVSDPSLINVPTISIQNVPYGKYVLRIETMNNTNYKLDGVRIYHPADETNETVQNAYANDGEQNAVFTQVRQLLISAEDFTSGMSSVAGAVYTDKLHDGATITDYEKIGPKNEVYLDNGDAIAFKVDGYQSGMKVMVGLSAPEQTTDAGDSVTAKQRQVTVSNGSAAKTQNISSNVDMYYAVTPTADGYVVITNTGSALISVTNVKLSGTAEGAGTFSVDDGLLAYMASFDSLEVTEPTPDEPDPIPDTPVQNDSISAIIHAIWSSVRDSIGRLFGRL